MTNIAPASGWQRDPVIASIRAELARKGIRPNALPKLDGWPSHSLRRRFATKIENETHDIRSIQMLLGHSDLSTTQRYLGKSSGQLRTAVSYAA